MTDLDRTLSSGDDEYGRAHPEGPCRVCGSIPRAFGRTICQPCVDNDCVIASGTCLCPMERFA